MLESDDCVQADHSEGLDPSGLSTERLDSLWLGNFDDALGYFENAVNKNPSRADAWVQVGFCRVKQGKNDEAIKAYHQAVLLMPESDEIRNKLGDAYYYSGNLMEAISAYKEVYDTSQRPKVLQSCPCILRSAINKSLNEARSQVTGWDVARLDER